MVCSYVFWTFSCLIKSITFIAGNTSRDINKGLTLLNSLPAGTKRFIPEICKFLQEHTELPGLMGCDKAHILYAFLTASKSNPLFSIGEAILKTHEFFARIGTGIHKRAQEKSLHFFDALANKFGTFIVYNAPTGNYFMPKV